MEHSATVRTAAAVVMASLTMAACGGGDTPGATIPDQASTTAVETAAPTTAAAEDPAALGDEIGDLFVQAYADVAAALADRPDSVAASALMTDLKEAYVMQMVALGHRREALDDAGRAVVDARISLAIGGVSAETFGAYQEAWNHYSSDPELASLIADFNIIGQYANFDLLREQDPGEAARLGL